MLRIYYSPDEHSGSDEAAKRLSDKFGIPEAEVQRLLKGNPTHPAPVIKNEYVMNRNGWNAISTLGALLGVVGILSLIVVIIMLMRPHHEPSMMAFHPPFIEQPAPSPPATAPGPSMDSCCQPKAEAAMPMKEEPKEDAKEEPKPKTAKPRHQISRKISGYNTSNSMEAEERLAELRAEGNTKAKIRSFKKDGVLMFEVK